MRYAGAPAAAAASCQPPKTRSTSLPKPKSSTETKRHDGEHEDQDDGGVGDQLVAGRPDDLRSSATTCRKNRRDARTPGRRRCSAAACSSMARSRSHLVVAGVGRIAATAVAPDGHGGSTAGRGRRADRRAGGTRTPNRRFWRPGLCQLSYCPTGRRRRAPASACSIGMHGSSQPPAASVRIRTVAGRTARRGRPWRPARATARSREGARMEPVTRADRSTGSTTVDPAAPGAARSDLAPHRRHRRVGHPRRRRQGQGAQGRRPAGDRLRRRRAGLPDPGLHRRGRDRRLRRTRRTTGTPPPAGLPELRAAVAAKTARDSGYDVAPEQVLVTNGGKQAVYQAFATLLDPGDEVLLPAPYWTTYPEAIRLAGGVPVEVFAGEDQGYLVTVEQLEAARTAADQGAAVLLAVQPDRRGLPPGAGRGDRAVGGRARHLGGHRRDLRAPRRTTAPRSRRCRSWCPELADTCVVVNGVAKTYAMTGWRVGWMIGPRDVVKAATNLQSHLTSNVANVSQRAALAALHRRPVGRRRDAGRLRPAPADDRRDAQRDRRRGLPDAAGRVLRLPVGARACSGRTIRGPDADDVGRAGRAHPRRGRGRGRARRGVRAQRLPAAVVRPRATTTSSRASAGSRSCSADRRRLEPCRGDVAATRRPRRVRCSVTAPD